ncbi:MAG TPA: SGNH/GDSL hydrolase family protein [Candidatus Aquilonibacter sp.]
MLNVLLAVALVLHWVGTWASAPVWADPKATFTDVTLREVIHTSIGGTRVRVRFSNSFGESPLEIERASIAVRSSGAGTSGVPTALMFQGRRTIVVPPGAQVLSDPLDLRVPARSDLAISIYLPGPTGPPTTHILAFQTNYAAQGDHVMDTSGAAFTTTSTQWYFLSGVDVATTRAAGSIVAFGDSITDGARSRTDENGRWPDVLASRAHGVGVLNAGISGNRILLDGGHYGVNALARFDRDVLAQTGVRSMIVLLGVNDIQQQPHQLDPVQIETGLLQIATQAHQHGLKIMVGTIMPIEGSYSYFPEIEATRQAVNAFIRASRVFDGIVDFDKAMRDPSDPHRLLPAYDGGDHLHPSPKGLRVMGELVYKDAVRSGLVAI